MLIVSQDKETVTNLKNIRCVQVESQVKSTEIYVYFEEYDYKLAGTYTDYTRAMDVLQELWSAYANGDKVFIMPEN